MKSKAILIISIFFSCLCNGQIKLMEEPDWTKNIRKQVKEWVESEYVNRFMDMKLIFPETFTKTGQFEFHVEGQVVGIRKMNK